MKKFYAKVTEGDIMIIKRKYCSYGQLLNDPTTLKAIEDTYKRYNLSKEQMDKEMSSAYNILFLNTNIETGLTGKVYVDLKEEFERLDQTSLFDNGLNYLHVTDTLCLPNMDGSSVTQILICRQMDSPSLIVQVVAFENAGNTIKSIQPQEIDFNLNI